MQVFICFLTVTFSCPIFKKLVTSSCLKCVFSNELNFSWFNFFVEHFVFISFSQCYKLYLDWKGSVRQKKRRWHLLPKLVFISIKSNCFKNFVTSYMKMFLRQGELVLTPCTDWGKKLEGGGSYTNIRGVWPSFSCMDPAVAFMPPLLIKTKRTNKNYLLD